MSSKWFLSILSAVAMASGVTPLHAGEKALTLLNVSYDPTPELYQDLNAAFAELSRMAGVRAVPVVLPQPEAAIDVDKPSDLAQAERILASRH